MRLTDELTDGAVLETIGSRAERQRIDAGLTQAELAHEAGVSKRTVERIEAGKGSELVMLIRVLRVLKLIEGFNALLPDVPPSPMALLKMKGKERRRVARSRRVVGSRASIATPPAALATSAVPAARNKTWTWKE
jgi:DNA-binding XRE family transcriptional regulator